MKKIRMDRFRLALIPLALTVITCTESSLSASPREASTIEIAGGVSVPNELQAFVKRMSNERKLADAQQIAAARRLGIETRSWASPSIAKLLSGDIDNDGKSDLALVYSLEGMGGGNYFESELAVFHGGPDGYQFADRTLLGSQPNIQAFGVLDPIEITTGAILCRCTDAFGAARDDIRCPNSARYYRLPFRNGRLGDARPPWK